MDCKKMEEMIMTDYIDGEMSGPALRDVEAHLASCIRCRGLASEVSAISSGLKNSKRLEPPSRVWERIRAEISKKPVVARTFSTTGFFESARLFVARLRPAIAAATAAVLILAVLAVARLMPQKGALTQDDVISLISLDSNGNDQSYDYGTAEEIYFL